ncbi:Aspartyl protease family protein [Camellia lanceoleosa]|uniref:Aspartyl protease family protein n=1 Tax=Camellia lanceoleosa TaxID=1840588 RepID=A0ACC0FLN7_9ERIC|nr:Aspartyl protease family protein [Camellia lanceoleosa]
MTQYRMIKPMSGFDTCFRVKKNTTLKIPSISFVFGGNIEVAIDYSGILLADSSNAFLAFLGNSNSSDLLIFGNAQQKTLDVVYDVAGGKLGFGHRDLEGEHGSAAVNATFFELVVAGWVEPLLVFSLQCVGGLVPCLWSAPVVVLFCPGSAANVLLILVFGYMVFSYTYKFVVTCNMLR